MPASTKCVLIVADPPRIGALSDALAEPLPQATPDVTIEVLSSSGGDDTIELFEARRPHVVVVTATLELGDTRALVETLRGMVPRAHVAIVVVGDEAGPYRTALDVTELAPEGFVTSPVADNALRFAVGRGLEAVDLARGTVASGAVPGEVVEEEPTIAQRATQRARWEALADSFAGIPDGDLDDVGDLDDPEPLPALDLGPRRAPADLARPQAWKPGTTAEVEPPTREPTLILREPAPAPEASVSAAVAAPPPSPPGASRAEPWTGPLPLAELLAVAPTPDASPPAPEAEPASAPPAEGGPETRDFARQLRAKMSMMAKRLFQGVEAVAPSAADLKPRHDHHTEIDLSSLGEEIPLERGVTEIEARAALESVDPRAMTTSPGSWDTAIRERGLPDHGEIVRGLSDAAMLLAKMFAQSSTGRISFRQVVDGREIEKTVYFDQGRPVFASSSEPGDRMGELLVREGKITAAQYERCQAVVAESGRRMGEILVDVGYLKRRELLPAVRRHVEDIVYSLFGWDRGTYHIALDETPCAERIRLSRHPAALILEGIRRKLDRSSLERLVGPPSTVIELPDRERLGGVIQLGDLAPEERGALAALDGQSDLDAIARAAGGDVTDVLPLVWGLCVLGLATARRSETEVPDESSALVGETDLAIDRERVRARWQLVMEADYFALLGVRRDATAFEIRRAYQAARRDFAAEGFPPELRRELAHELDDIGNVLDEAFRVLRDDRLRLTYLANLIE